MSLRVWLPLDGNLKNYGASETNLVTNTGATVNASGKIGSCYYFDNHYLSYTCEAIRSFTESSISLWVKIPTSQTKAAWLLTLRSASSGNNLIFCIDVNTNGVMEMRISDGTNITAQSTGVTVRDNNWHNLCLTYTPGIIKSFVDGVPKYSKETTVVPAFNSVANIYIGSLPNSTEGLAGGYINDCRIYDHCLSRDEIKEISRALVLYYPLNNTSIKTPNLIERMEAGGRTTLINNYTFDATFTSSDTYAWFDTYPALTLGKTYTLSFDVENLASGSAWTWCLWNNANYPVAITKNGHYSYTFIPDESKLPSGYSLSRFLFDDAGKTNPTGTVRFKNFKIELGEKDTPFCIINEVPEIYDNSGYNRHGTVTSSTCPIIATGSPRNSHCCQFDGTDDYIVAPVKQGDILSDKKFTISAWVYMTNFREARGIFGPHNVSPARGICFCQCQGSSNKILFSYGGNNAWRQIQDNTGYSLNTWYNYVWTYDGSTAIVYKNGTQIGTATGSLDFSEDMITVGRAYNSSDRYWQGKISDLKVYATVLSASDIEKEYHRYAAIYNNHSMAANEFIESRENSKADIRINGVVRGALVEGDYSKVSIISSSGNIQATEFIEGI